MGRDWTFGLRWWYCHLCLEYRRDEKGRRCPICDFLRVASSAREQALYAALVLDPLTGWAQIDVIPQYRVNAWPTGEPSPLGFEYFYDFLFLAPDVRQEIYWGVLLELDGPYHELSHDRRKDANANDWWNGVGADGFMLREILRLPNARVDQLGPATTARRLAEGMAKVAHIPYDEIVAADRYRAKE